MKIQKLAAIYNVFDGIELLKGSINCLLNDVDLFIIVFQDISNFGEEKVCNHDLTEALSNIPIEKIELVKFTPTQIAGQPNETIKRNLGIQSAKFNGCTHFIQMDADEYYEDFSKAKQMYIDSEAKGSVCKMMTYFKKPTFRFENPDNYYVPFIHQLNENTITGSRNYPFYCDRTRCVNEEKVIELPILMHHYSWVRKDIEMKIRNSSAKVNIERSQLLADYKNPELTEGFFVKDFNQKLLEVKNIFNIPY